MSTINTIIKLHDGMTPALQRINKSLGTTQTNFEAMQRATGHAIDTKKLQAGSVALDKIADNTAEAAGMTQKLDKGFDKVVAALGLVCKELGEMGMSMRAIVGNTDLVAKKVVSIDKNQKTLNASVAKGFTTLDKNQRAIHQANVNQIRLTASFKKGVTAATQMLQPISRVDDEINKGTAAQQRFNTAANSGSGAIGKLVSQVKTLVGAYMGIQTAGGIIGTADALSSLKGRLGLINDGKQSVAELQEMIYQSSMRSAANFLDTADAITKLGLNAGDAFGNNAELVLFTETLNKMFGIAKATPAEMASATLQLSQALSAGALMGEEFRAVGESAPLVKKAIADYLGVAKGELKKLASDGKLTADVVKNAVLSATGEVNKQFKTLDLTWTQVWTLIKNYTINASDSILAAISKITSSKRFIRFANGVGNAITRITGFLRNVGSVISPVLGWIFDKVAGIFNFISSNWSFIAPIVLGIAAAFLVLKTPVMLMAIWTGICTAATTLWTAAQAVFNAVMAANPITLVILVIIALVAAIYLAVAAVNHFAGTSYSATGFICAAFMGLYTSVYNKIAVLWNVFASFAEFLCNLFIDPVYAVKKLFVDLATIVLDIISSMSTGWIEHARGVIDVMTSAINGVLKCYNAFADSWLGKKLGINSVQLTTSDAVISKLNGFNSKISSAKASMQSWLGKAPENAISIPRMELKNYAENMTSGYKWGAEKETQIGNFFAGKKFKALSGDELNKLKELYGPNVDKYGNVTNPTGKNDLGKALSGALGDDPNLKKIAANTGDISKSLNTSEEDLSYMRDLREREALNRHQLMNIKIDMTNNNNIKSGMDVNAFLEQVQAALYEGVTAAAEGVHF